MAIQKPLPRFVCRPIGLVLGFALMVLAITTQADADDYRLFAGDSITVSVFPYPEVSGIFELDAGGQFKLPLMDPISGSGRTTEELRKLITEQLEQLIDGKLEVSVVVAEYRPLFIDGDVTSPGAYPYRPGMTVAIAVTLAGGRQSVRASGSLLGLSREQEQFEQLLDAYRTNIAREARLLAEQADSKTVRFPEDLEAAADSSARVLEILDNERAIMVSRLNLQAIERGSLQRRVKDLDQVIVELESQKESINSRRELYEEQFEIIRDVAGQGIVPKAALLRLEITAATLEQEARAAEISIIQARQSRVSARTQLANLPTERKAEITAALQDVQDVLAQSQIQLDQSTRRLAALNAQAPPGGAPDVDKVSPRISISRVTEPLTMATSVFEADWDSKVLPGDMIQIPYPEFSAPDGFDTVIPKRLKSTAN